MFSEFPILEGEGIRLRKVSSLDIPELFEMLNDKDIIQEYSAIGKYDNVNQVAVNFLFSPEDNFKNETSLTWAIEEKKSARIIGIRELFIDTPERHVTVQGFIGKEFRKKGFSKESYNLIIDFLRNVGAIGIFANASLDNYSAIALLFSVGFRQNYVAFTQDGMRGVFVHELDYFSKPLFAKEELKRIFVFSKMYLCGTNIQIQENALVQEGRNTKKYDVTLKAVNTSGNSIYSIYTRDLYFYSDGYSIFSYFVNGLSGPIDGIMDYGWAYKFAWDCCYKKK